MNKVKRDPENWASATSHKSAAQIRVLVGRVLLREAPGPLCLTVSDVPAQDPELTELRQHRVGLPLSAGLRGPGVGPKRGSHRPTTAPNRHSLSPLLCRLDFAQGRRRSLQLQGQDGVGAGLLLPRLTPSHRLRPVQPVAPAPSLPDFPPATDDLRGLVSPENRKVSWGGLSPLSTEPRDSPVELGPEGGGWAHGSWE